MPIAEIIEKAVLAVIGFGVWFGLLYLILFRDAHFWRTLSQSYASEWRRPIAARHLQSAVAYGNGIAAKSYKGLLTIGLHETGMALRVLPPFSFFHKSLFIPFTDIKGWEQFWYLDSKSYELEFRSAPDVKLVMPADQVRWLQNASRGQMEIVDKPSPHRDRPNIWYAIIILQGAMALALLAYVLFGGHF